jgi:hypothetical protein
MLQIETTRGVNSGAYVIGCDGTCDTPRLDHMYIGYDSEEATALYNESHNGGDGLN